MVRRKQESGDVVLYMIRRQDGGGSGVREDDALDEQSTEERACDCVRYYEESPYNKRREANANHNKAKGGL